MQTEYYNNFDQAIKRALAWLRERGITQLDEAYVGKMGGFGMRTLDKSAGYRIEFDDRCSAHINIWTHYEHGPHCIFPGNEQAVKAIWRQLFYWDPKLKSRKTDA